MYQPLVIQCQRALERRLALQGRSLLHTSGAQLRGAGTCADCRTHSFNALAPEKLRAQLFPSTRHAAITPVSAAGPLAKIGAPEADYE